MFASTKEFFLESSETSSELTMDALISIWNYLIAMDDATNSPSARTEPDFNYYTPVYASTASREIVKTPTTSALAATYTVLSVSMIRDTPQAVCSLPCS